MNQRTSYLDLSQVYGNNVNIMLSLRTRHGGNAFILKRRKHSDTIKQFYFFAVCRDECTLTHFFNIVAKFLLVLKTAVGKQFIALKFQKAFTQYLSTYKKCKINKYFSRWAAGGTRWSLARQSTWRKPRLYRRTSVFQSR